MGFEGNERNVSDDSLGERDREDEDRDDMSDSSIDSDFNRDSKQMLDESFFMQRQFLLYTQTLNSEMGMSDDDMKSNNHLNGLNGSDPHFIDSKIDIDS